MSDQGAAPELGRRGRPPSCSPELAVRIVGLRRQGLSYEQISARLNADGVSTPMGRPRWLKSHVDRLLHTRYMQEIIEEGGGYEPGHPPRVDPFSL